MPAAPSPSQCLVSRERALIELEAANNRQAAEQGDQGDDMACSLSPQIPDLQNGLEGRNAFVLVHGRATCRGGRKGRE